MIGLFYAPLLFLTNPIGATIFLIGFVVAVISTVFAGGRVGLLVFKVFGVLFGVLPFLFLIVPSIISLVSPTIGRNDESLFILRIAGLCVAFGWWFGFGLVLLSRFVLTWQSDAETHVGAGALQRNWAESLVPILKHNAVRLALSGAAIVIFFIYCSLNVRGPLDGFPFGLLAPPLVAVWMPTATLRIRLIALVVGLLSFVIFYIAAQVAMWSVVTSVRGAASIAFSLPFVVTTLGCSWITWMVIRVGAPKAKDENQKPD